MIDYTDVDAKLDEYSEAFDFYMESDEMPPGVSDEDCLIGYMREVIDNNPQIDGNDPTWVEVLKEDLISFFTALLEQFRALQLEAMKELALIATFAKAPIEQKRLMWHEVSETIKTGYSTYDVNLPGFTAQFKGDDKEAVFAALTSDWRDACKDKLDRRERQMLARSKRQFEKIRSYTNLYRQLFLKTAPLTRLTEWSQTTILNGCCPLNCQCPRICSTNGSPQKNSSCSAAPARTSHARWKNTKKAPV